ncbi:MAG: hypothetical protein GWO19_15200 [Nitrospinaceae bacterium]|nr:hypothetical protein [Nitrospinaceae bacterium]NIS86203.1 hypothetical protein [Nitrospinaceae bacterium]
MVKSKPKKEKSKYKTIFIVDPVRSDRIQLSKFIKQEFFTVMSFVSITDCFKGPELLSCDLVIFVLRKGKAEVKHLRNIKKKYKKLNFILMTNPDLPDVNLTDLKSFGFTSVQRAGSLEKVKEITLGLLAPEGIPPRTETPHPVPIPEEYQVLLQNNES